jgi:purine-cytosine permease-like protein
VDETAAGWASLWTGAPLGAPVFFRSSTIARVHRPNPPSIDPGVMAFVWALLLAVFVYFGLKAVGASGAASIVLALLAFAGIWLFVRLRGEDRPGI